MKKINLNIIDNWKDKLFSVLYYIGVFVYLELMLHIVVFKSVGIRIFYPIFFAIISGCLIYTLFSLLPEKVNKFLGMAAVFGIVIYFEVQLVYHCIFGSFMPVSQMTLGADAVTNFFAQVIHAIITNIFIVALVFVPAPITIILFLKNKIKTKRITLLQTGSCLVICALISLITVASLHLFKKSESSVYNIFFNPDTSTEASVKNVGLAATLLQETRGLFNADEKIYEFKETTLDKIDNSDKELNATDINFSKLNEKADDKTINLVNNHLMSVSPSSKNEFTGIAKDYNLITICAESFSPIFVSEQLTPTLYKLSNNGIVFKNFYNCFPNTTTNGEYSFVMGLMPNMSRTKVASSFDDSIGNYLPYSLGNVYKDLGLGAYGYHNYYGTFYDRVITHANLGYDFKAVDAGLDIQVNWPSSDLDMIKASMNDYINSDKPFHAYYMTFSGHYQYNWDNAMSAKNKAAVANLPYSEEVKAYIACNLELEYALTELMAGLEKAGKADKTVIVLTGDHYPYGLTEEQFNELAGKEVDTEFEKYRNSFICYVPGITTTVVDEYCSTQDILPTVLNIMGLEYDSRLLAGRDVLSDAPHIAVLADQSFITKDFRYNASTGIATKNDGTEADPQIVSDYCNYVANMFTLSSAILDTNYYSHVFDKESTYESPEYVRYDDITNPFFESAVTFMVNNGYMTPESNTMFGVSKKVLKSDFINIIYQMAGSPKVDANEGKQSAFKWATENGIISENTTLSGEITYMEAASMIYKYVNMTVGIPKDNELGEINKLSVQYPNMTRDEIIIMKWCIAKNIISGEKNTTPYSIYNKTINRGQAAVYLQRMYFLSINN